MGAWVLTQIDDIDVHKPIHLLGHDWGSVIAQYIFLVDQSRLSVGSKMDGQLIFKSIIVMAVPFGMLRNTIRTTFQNDQVFRSRYMAAFQIPFMPELLITNKGGEFIEKFMEAWSPTWEAKDPSRIKRIKDVRSILANPGHPTIVKNALEYYRSNIPFPNGHTFYEYLGKIILLTIYPIFLFVTTLWRKLLFPSPITQGILDGCASVVGTVHPMGSLNLPKNCKMKILQICGVNDGCVHHSLFDFNQEEFKNVTLLKVPGAGHWVHLEAKAVVHAAVLKHLDSCKGYGWEEG